jgi:electron transfer flavoprotein beta subunit
MKIVVCVKWVGAVSDDIEFDSSNRHIDIDYLDFSVNEWDAAATAEAIRIRDGIGGDSEVIVVTVGDKEADNVLIQCLAMGANRAIRAENNDLDIVDPISIARLLSKTIESESPDLILCGAQSSDASQGSTGAAIAGFLDIPCLTLVTNINYAINSKVSTIRRELEGGRIEVTELHGPGVLTIQTGSIEPRYVTIRAIQEAKNRPIENFSWPSNDDGYRGFTITKMAIPQQARAELIEGGASSIAARIFQLVKGVSE